MRAYLPTDRFVESERNAALEKAFVLPVEEGRQLLRAVIFEVAGGGALVSVPHDDADLLQQALACVLACEPNSVNVPGFERLQRDFDALLREFRRRARGES